MTSPGALIVNNLPDFIMIKTVDHLDPETIIRLYNLHRSKRRLTILSILCANNQPVSLSMLARKMKGVNMSILYKNLHVLETAGIIYRITDSRGIRYFAVDTLAPDEHTPGVHWHFNCLRCKKLYYLPRQTIQPPPVSDGFIADRYIYCLYGTCGKCGKISAINPSGPA